MPRVLTQLACHYAVIVSLSLSGMSASAIAETPHVIDPAPAVDMPTWDATQLAQSSELERLQTLLREREQESAKVQVTLLAQIQEAERLRSVGVEREQELANLRTNLLAREQERDSLRGQLRTAEQMLQRVRAENTEFTARLAKTEKALSESGDKAAQLSQAVQLAREEHARLTQDYQRQEELLRDSNQSLDAARIEIARLSQAHALANADNQRLNQNNAQLLTRVTTAEQTLAGLRQQQQDLQQQLAQLRPLLPVQQGGSATLEELRQQAGQAAAHLNLARQALTRNRADPGLAAEYQAAVDELRLQQLRLAIAIGARGVYRLRREDSLAKIATRHYGASTREEELYEANRHVLERPDRLLTDITLIIP